MFHSREPKDSSPLVFHLILFDLSIPVTVRTVRTFEKCYKNEPGPELNVNK